MGKKQNDAFHAIARSYADFECHVIIVESFCAAQLRAKACMYKFHCAIVCKSVTWVRAARIDRSISAAGRERDNKKRIKKGILSGRHARVSFSTAVVI